MTPTVQTLEMLNSLQNHEEGELVHVESENQDYFYHNGSWIPYFPTEEDASQSEAPQVDLYKINQMLVAQLPDLSEEEVSNAKTIIKNYVDNEDATYYMLLCNDLHYYTVFVKNSKTSDVLLEDEVIACCNYLGTMKSVELAKDLSHIEVWFTRDAEAHVAYLFNYDKGVILCQ